MRRLAVLAMAFGFVVAGAAPASGDHLDVDASIPESVRAGDLVQLSVVVRSTDTGETIEGATVIALREASIVGVAGEVEVARAASDANGVATLRWQARSGAEDAVVLAYAQVGELTLESEPLAVVTIGPGPQIVRSRAGVRIPGLGAWVLIALLVGIWATIQFALVGPVRVAIAAHAAERAEEQAG